MDKQILTNTKHSSIRNYHTPNNQYNNNKNQQTNRSADTTTNYNVKQRALFYFCVSNIIFFAIYSCQKCIITFCHE